MGRDAGQHGLGPQGKWHRRWPHPAAENTSLCDRQGDAERSTVADVHLLNLSEDCQAISIPNEFKEFKIGLDASPLKAAFETKKAVLLLDEPFGALDALTRAHLQDSVMQIHARLGNTAIMITHDVDESVLLSDRIVMMTNGPAASIGEVLRVNLPRPRHRIELANDPEYLRCRQAVLRFLYERHRLMDTAA